MEVLETLSISGIVLFILGMVLISLGWKKEQTEGLASHPWSLQVGYVCVAFGFGFIMQEFMGFNEIFFLVVVFTGIVVLLDKFIYAPRRENKKEHHLIEYSRSIFPVILVMFVLRTFIVEPFQIPSSSMRPNLVVGDFILVNKISYGVRILFSDKLLFKTGEVSRGEVVVFQYPKEPSSAFIKRVIGLPGDFVEYRDKTLWVNGEMVSDVPNGTYVYEDVEGDSGVKGYELKRYTETLGDVSYDVLKMDNMPSIFLNYVDEFEGKENCRYEYDGFACKIPDKKYLFIGDNRDHSHDGRYWGFVDEEMLIGRAELIWLNFKEPSRIGTRF